MPAATLLATDTLYKYRSFAYSGNQVAINTRYFTADTIVGAPTEEDALLSLDLVGAGLYKPCMPAVSQYVGSDLQNISTLVPYEEPLFTNDNAGNGTAAGNPLPAQVSGLVTHLTGLAGRKYRGRAYIPFPSDTFISATAPQTPNGAYVTVLEQFVLFMTGSVGYIAAGGKSWNVQWQLFHRDSLTYTRIVGGRPNRLWATQRRRGDYGRPNPVPVV